MPTILGNGETTPTAAVVIIKPVPRKYINIGDIVSYGLSILSIDVINKNTPAKTRITTKVS